MGAGASPARCVGHRSGRSWWGGGGRITVWFASARANSLMVRSGDFLRVPFFLRKNGHESIDSLYTLREFALALVLRLDSGGINADGTDSAGRHVAGCGCGGGTDGGRCEFAATGGECGGVSGEWGV